MVKGASLQGFARSAEGEDFVWRVRGEKNHEDIGRREKGGSAKL